MWHRQAAGTLQRQGTRLHAQQACAKTAFSAAANDELRATQLTAGALACVHDGTKNGRTQHAAINIRRIAFVHTSSNAEFKGNKEDYYNPDNSCINVVLERRLGIPITLVCVRWRACMCERLRVCRDACVGPG